MIINQELKKVLEKVPDAYFDFIYGMCGEIKDDKELADAVIEYIKKNPNTNTSEITIFYNELVGVVPVSE